MKSGYGGCDCTPEYMIPCPRNGAYKGGADDV